MVSSPADALWSSLLLNDRFYKYFVAENRLRLADAYEYTAAWCKYHNIAHVNSNAGHFVLVDLARFMPRNLAGKALDEQEEETALWARVRNMSFSPSLLLAFYCT